MTQLPTFRANPSALRFDVEEREKTNVERDDSDIPGSPLAPDECGDTESDFELQVRIERSIVLDGGLQDKDSEEQDFDSHKYVWKQEYNV
jgi:hypothetical protein